MGPQTVVAAAVVDGDLDPHRPLAGAQLDRGVHLVGDLADAAIEALAARGPRYGGDDQHAGPHRSALQHRHVDADRARRRARRRRAGTSCRCRRRLRRRPAGRTAACRRPRTCRRRGRSATVTWPLARGRPGSDPSSPSVTVTGAAAGGVAGRPARQPRPGPRRPRPGTATCGCCRTLSTSSPVSSTSAMADRTSAVTIWPVPSRRLATSTEPSGVSSEKAEPGDPVDLLGGGQDDGGGPAVQHRVGGRARSSCVPAGASVPGRVARRRRHGGRAVGLTTTGPSWSTRAARWATARSASPSAMSAASL